MIEKIKFVSKVPIRTKMPYIHLAHDVKNLLKKISYKKACRPQFHQKTGLEKKALISVEKMKGPGGLKPKPLIFQWRRLIRLAGVHPTEVTVIDDCLRNLRTAKLLGCRTIWAQCFNKNDVKFFLECFRFEILYKKVDNLIY